MKINDLVDSQQFEDFCDNCEFNYRIVNGELELCCISIEGSPCLYFSPNENWPNFIAFFESVQEKLDEMSDEINTLSDNINEYAEYFEDNNDEYDDLEYDE